MRDEHSTQWSAADYLEAAAEGEYRYVDDRAERAKLKAGRLARKIEALQNWGPLRFLKAGTRGGGDR